MDKAEKGLDLSGTWVRGKGPLLHGGDFVMHGLDALLRDAMP